jgi:hypothetical protein
MTSLPPAPKALRLRADEGGRALRYAVTELRNEAREQVSRIGAAGSVTEQAARAAVAEAFDRMASRLERYL